MGSDEPDFRFLFLFQDWLPIASSWAAGVIIAGGKRLQTSETLLVVQHGIAMRCESREKCPPSELAARARGALEIIGRCTMICDH